MMGANLANGLFDHDSRMFIVRSVEGDFGWLNISETGCSQGPEI